MKYEYNFRQSNCWYKNSCQDFKSEKCNEHCLRYQYLDYQVSQSLLKPRQQYRQRMVTPEVDKAAFERLAEIKGDIVNYVRRGSNLMLMSENCGNGKTCWMERMTMQYLSNMRDFEHPRALFISYPKFAVMHKNMFNGYMHEDLKHILDFVEKVDLVVWDDIAVSSLTEYDTLNLYVYVNERMNAGKSNFYTMNCDDKQAYKLLGPRLYSRVFRGSEILEFKANDMRGDVQSKQDK